MYSESCIFATAMGVLIVVMASIHKQVKTKQAQLFLGEYKTFLSIMFQLVR